jgi:ribosomal protein S18 acetylase RimI-like enzyme
MTIRICQADPTTDAPQVRELCWEYLEWANARINEEFSVNFDTKTLIEHDMTTLDKFMPPKGRLLLGYSDDHLAGVACLRELTQDTGEIKRMYVRPAFRQQGLGRALANQLIEEANAIGYQRIRLDSARFMQEAHNLYRALGFREIEPYVGSEIPREFQVNWIFMEKTLK